IPASASDLSCAELFSRPVKQPATIIYDRGTVQNLSIRALHTKALDLFADGTHTGKKLGRLPKGQT
ncbi:hypothetical protein BaRGS_00008615, partial [Batillaria attramentaria]